MSKKKSEAPVEVPVEVIEAAEAENAETAEEEAERNAHLPTYKNKRPHKIAEKPAPAGPRTIEGTLNPLKLPFNTDREGICAKLRSGGLASANRLGTDPVRLERYLQSLQVLAIYAKGKQADNIAKLEKRKANAAAASARANSVKARLAAEKVALLRKSVAAAEARAEALGYVEEVSLDKE